MSFGWSVGNKFFQILTYLTQNFWPLKNGEELTGPKTFDEKLSSVQHLLQFCGLIFSLPILTSKWNGTFFLTKSCDFYHQYKKSFINAWCDKSIPDLRICPTLWSQPSDLYVYSKPWRPVCKTSCSILEFSLQFEMQILTRNSAYKPC